MIIILQPLTNVNWFFDFFVFIFRVGNGGRYNESIVCVAGTGMKIYQNLCNGCQLRFPVLQYFLRRVGIVREVS